MVKNSTVKGRGKREEMGRMRCDGKGGEGKGHTLESKKNCTSERSEDMTASPSTGFCASIFWRRPLVALTCATNELGVAVWAR
jgi:hypothetical protein